MSRLLAQQQGITGEITRRATRPCRGWGRRHAQAEIYLFDFTGLGFFYFFFFFPSLKCPPGNCSPWNINATQEVTSLKCHLAVISPALIIPQAAQAPISPCPQCPGTWGSPARPLCCSTSAAPSCHPKSSWPSSTTAEVGCTSSSISR